MALPEIKYNLHDATIVNASFDVKGRVEVVIELYEIFYPNKPIIKLIISGIVNTEKVRGLVQGMLDDPCEDNWLGYRINGFQYDAKRQSKKDDLYFYLDVEHIKPVKIHCKKINFLGNHEIT